MRRKREVRINRTVIGVLSELSRRRGHTGLQTYVNIVDEDTYRILICALSSARGEEFYDYPFPGDRELWEAVRRHTATLREDPIMMWVLDEATTAFSHGESEDGLYFKPFVKTAEAAFSHGGTLGALFKTLQTKAIWYKKPGYIRAVEPGGLVVAEFWPDEWATVKVEGRWKEVSLEDGAFSGVSAIKLFDSNRVNPNAGLDSYCERLAG